MVIIMHLLCCTSNTALVTALSAWLIMCTRSALRLCLMFALTGLSMHALDRSSLPTGTPTSWRCVEASVNAFSNN